MKFKFFAALAATIAMTASCGIMSNSGSSLSNMGKSSGIALASLYSQYRADGRVDMKNLNNIINIATIVNDLQTAKSQDEKSLQSDDFVSGLITGSMQLVNQKNSTSVLDNLATIAKLNLSEITNAAATATAATAAAANNTATAAANTAATAAAATDSAVTSAINKINTTTSNVTTALNAFGNIFNAFK